MPDERMELHHKIYQETYYGQPHLPWNQLKNYMSEDVLICVRLQNENNEFCFETYR